MIGLNIVDIIIILFILAYGMVGLKRGVIKELVMTIGIILVFILSFYLKTPVASFISLHLPFLDLEIFDGFNILNVIIYQMVAFVFVFIVLLIILNVLIKISEGLEKILKFTVILAAPSKVLGFIVGLIEGYVVVFIVSFILSIPTLKVNVVRDSYLVPKILNSSPLLSNVVEDTTTSFTNIYNIIKEYKDTKDSNKFNEEILRELLNADLVSKSYVEKLKEKGKIEVSDIDNLLKNE